MNGVLTSPSQVHHGLWLGGGWLLTLLALATIASVVVTREGLPLLVLALPPFVAGAAVIRSTRDARPIGAA